MIHRPVSTLLAFLLVLIICGCGDSTDSTGFSVRAFQPFSGDNWIGNAISYGPHRDGQRPGGPDPTADQIREDMRLMLTHWNLLRVYGAIGASETVLEVIQEEKLDMKVMLGVWIAQDGEEANQKEIAAAIRLVNTYSDIIISVSVGNETQVYWSAHKNPLDELIGYVRQVRAAVTVPVTRFLLWSIAM